MKELKRIQTNIYNNVKKLCFIEGIESLHKFEVMCGLSRGYIKRCAKGKYSYRLSTLIRMADILGVDLVELLED